MKTISDENFKFKSGDRVVALKDLSQEADEDMPAVQFCVEGQVLSIVGTQIHKGDGKPTYDVIDEGGLYGTFWVYENEIKILNKGESE